MQNQGLANTLTPFLGIFLEPPVYTLPEEIRKSIRFMIECQDTEWAQRHPDCIRKEHDAANDQGKWGDDCLGCFSAVPPLETIGRIETVIALHLAFSKVAKHTDNAANLMIHKMQSITELADNMEFLVANNWTRFFWVRDQLRQLLPLLKQLQEALAPSTLFSTDSQYTSAEGLEPQVVLLLNDVLTHGGLRSFIVRVDNKVILSPGMEILLMCLAECECSPEAQAVEKLLGQVLKPMEPNHV